MDGRSELFAYLGASLATIALLFGLQVWYASYLDVFVVNAQRVDLQPNVKVTAARKQEREKLATIGEAKQALAKRGRAGFPRIAAKSSDDLSAMAGWIHQPGFAPYVPRAQPKPVEVPAVDGGSVEAAPGPGDGERP